MYKLTLGLLLRFIGLGSPRCLAGKTDQGVALGDDAVNGGWRVPLEIGTGLALKELVSEGEKLTQEPAENIHKRLLAFVIISLSSSHVKVADYYSLMNQSVFSVLCMHPPPSFYMRMHSAKKNTAHETTRLQAPSINIIIT